MDTHLSSRIKTYVEIALVAIVLMFVCAIGVGVMVDIFWASDAKAPDAFRGGFIGAFFAFLSIRIGELLNRLNERIRKNNVALVTLQHRYMELAGEIQDNIYLLSTWDRMMSGLRANESYPIWTNRLSQLQIPRAEIIDLSNLDLVNDLFSINIKLRKANGTMDTFCAAYEKVRDAFIDKKMTSEDYRATLERIDQDRLLISKFLEALIEDLVAGLASIRVLLGDKTLAQKFFESVTVKHYPSNFEKRRTREIVELKSEVAENSKRSRKIIDAIIQNQKDAAGKLPK